jgi:hypothetical protein
MPPSTVNLARKVRRSGNGSTGQRFRRRNAYEFKSLH